MLSFIETQKEKRIRLAIMSGKKQFNDLRKKADRLRISTTPLMIQGIPNNYVQDLFRNVKGLAKRIHREAPPKTK